MLIAECKNNLYLTKQHSPSGTIGYGKAKFFSYEEENPQNFDDLVKIIRNLENEPHKCILRGHATEIKDGFKNLRRLKASGGPLTKVARMWALFDWDESGGVWAHWAKLALEDPERMVRRFLTEKCPLELATSDVYWQYGSSIGVNKEKFSLHLWVWLSEPVMDMKPYYLAHGFDPSMASAAQVHYTARPIFKDMDDPMPVRSGVIRGENNGR